ncbi:MAG TPA: glycosyltransferase [Stellaceae bacterium]|nr:glycosyltransferase [Stellaceae bacterium]
MRPRLLQAIAGARHGGAETFFLRLAAAFERRGAAAQRVLIRRDAERTRRLREAGVAVGELSFAGRFDVLTRLAFRREIGEWRPDIVLTWMNRATSLCPRGDFVHVGRLGGYYDLKYYRRCDYLIGNTAALVDWAVRRGWPRERVYHLPNFAPDPAAAAPLDRALLGTPEEAPLALALGRLHPNKGFDLLLAALAAVPQVHLWIAGTGALSASLERLALRLGLSRRVRFLGWREDVPELLASADFLVCPSRHEPLGNVVLEAWAARVPVVALASEGPRELIAHDQSGLLVPPEEAPGALARAIARLSEDPSLRARLAAGGRRAFETGFTEAAVVGRYRDFFERVAGQCAA